MPNITNGAHLFECFKMLGLARSTDMGGLRALEWQEIVAFATGTKRVSEPWEIETIYAMGQEYITGYSIGSKLFGIEPMEQIETGV